MAKYVQGEDDRGALVVSVSVPLWPARTSIAAQQFQITAVHDGIGVLDQTDGLAAQGQGLPATLRGRFLSEESGGDFAIGMFGAVHIERTQHRDQTVPMTFGEQHRARRLPGRAVFKPSAKALGARNPKREILVQRNDDREWLMRRGLVKPETVLTLRIGKDDVPAIEARLIF